MSSDSRISEASWRSGASLAFVLRVAAALVSLALVSVLVVRSSTAAFTDVTQNTGNAFVVGSIDLVDDDSAATMFNVSNMEPGQIVVDCIVVTYQGSVPDTSAVKVYSGGYTDSGTLATFLNLTVEEGAGGSFGDCTGFVNENTIVSSMALNTFDTTHTNYGNGAGVWDPSSTPVSKSYRVTVELDAATPNAQQGNQGQANRVWLNNGSGAFTDSGQTLGAFSSSSLSIGDVDGDGDLDVMVANVNQGNKVWSNDGSGVFTDSGQSLGTAASDGVTFGDVDGDGDLDAVVANMAQPNTVWLNNGSGTFTDSGQTLASWSSRFVVLGDGDLDAMVANYLEANKVWLNNGSGTFADSGLTLGSSASYGLVLVDFNSDGDLDALSANYNQATKVWSNT